MAAVARRSLEADYCGALAMQEQSLEQLQQHLRKTEELFRQSVKQKNQQLELLQTEVRRLRAAPPSETELQGAGELERLRQQLATRELELDALAEQVTTLKSDLAEERAWRQAEARTAAEALAAKSTVEEQRVQLDELRDQLAAAQRAATRLQEASAEAEAALIERDAELKRRRTWEDETRMSSHGTVEAARGCIGLGEGRGDPQLNGFPADPDLGMVSEEKAVLEEQLATARAEAVEATKRAEANAAEAAHAAAENARLGRLVEEKVSSAAQLRRRLEDEARQRSALEQRIQALNEDLEAAKAQRPLLQPQQDAHQESHQRRASEGSVAYPPMHTAKREAVGNGQAGPARSALSASEGALHTRTGTSEAPEIVRLELTGEAVVSHTLKVVTSVANPGTSLTYTWFRAGTPLKKCEGPEYNVTANDLRCEISVRVTPFGPDGAVGKPQIATTKGVVSLASDVPRMLREWVQHGECKFDKLLDESHGERVILLSGGKVKLREVKANGSEKTIVKDACMGVR